MNIPPYISQAFSDIGVGLNYAWIFFGVSVMMGKEWTKGFIGLNEENPSSFAGYAFQCLAYIMLVFAALGMAACVTSAIAKLWVGQ